MTDKRAFIICHAWNDRMIVYSYDMAKAQACANGLRLRGIDCYVRVCHD